MTLELGIDRTWCMGSGNCAYRAPGVFDVGEDGLAVVIGDRTSAEQRVRLAVDECPTKVISLLGEAC